MRKLTKLITNSLGLVILLGILTLPMAAVGLVNITAQETSVLSAKDVKDVTEVNDESANSQNPIVQVVESTQSTDPIFQR
jgi:hypothetical protein